MTALVLPIAHAGHWINGLLYLTPVVVIAVLLFVQSRRDAGKDEPDPDARETPDEKRD